MSIRDEAMAESSRPIPEDEAYCDRGPCWMHLGHDGPCQQDGPEMRGVMWERRRKRTDAEVEAAAQELWKHRALGTVHPNYPWNGLAPELRQSLRELARKVLSAARTARRDEEER